MSGPLDDIRVIEFAQVIAIPVCTQILRSMGADVVKVEPPTGDAVRVSRSSGVKGEGRLFLLHNRGKRSITLDLGHPDATEVVRGLVASADVVVTSFKRTDLPRYGLTYDELREIKPDLVYLENTPYGPEGDMADMGGYDPVVGGLSGISFLTAADVRGAPRLVLPAMNDFGTAFLSALGIVSAIRHRDRTGEGQLVETSLLSTSMLIGSQAGNWVDAIDGPRVEALKAELNDARAAGAGFDEQRSIWERSFRPDAAGNVFFRHYRCSDGFITVACLSNGLRKKLRSFLPISDPRSDPDFDADAAGAAEQIDEFVLAVENLFASQPGDRWLTELRAAGIPCGEFNIAEDGIFHPQVTANEYMDTIEHPTVGTFRAYAPPIRISGNDTGPLPPSPLLGEHTEQILLDSGFTPDDIVRIRQAGTLGDTD